MSSSSIAKLAEKLIKRLFITKLVNTFLPNLTALSSHSVHGETSPLYERYTDDSTYIWPEGALYSISFSAARYEVYLTIDLCVSVLL